MTSSWKTLSKLPWNTSVDGEILCYLMVVTDWHMAVDMFSFWSKIRICLAFWLQYHGWVIIYYISLWYVITYTCSNHKWTIFQPSKCRTHAELALEELFLIWWRHKMETFCALLALCAGNSSVTGQFPLQRPVMGSFDDFFDFHLNKRSSKQSRRW